MKKPSYSLVLVSCSLFVLALTVVVNYVIDPFTYYHQPRLNMNISKNQRYSNPGLARQWEYETVLLGTSLVMEIESSRLSEIAGAPALNLSVSAGLIREQSELARQVLQQGKARTVLWEVYYPTFAVGDVTGVAGQEFPQYFYTPTIETPFKYLMSFDTLAESRDALKDPGSVTVDNRNQQEQREYSRERILQNWDYRIEDWDEGQRQYWVSYQESVESPAVLLQRLVSPLIRANPDVTFKFFLPPHSILDFLIWADRGANDFAKWMQLRDSLAEFSTEFANVEVHDFQLEKEITENLDLYRDLVHYHPDVLYDVIKRVSTGSSQTEPEELRNNTRQLSARVVAYGRSFCLESPQRCPASLMSWLDTQH